MKLANRAAILAYSSSFVNGFDQSNQSSLHEIHDDRFNRLETIHENTDQSNSSEEKFVTKTPIVRAVVAKKYIQQWFDKNCPQDPTSPDAIRPERCSKKYERVFLEWDAMEHAFLQPCGFFDAEIYQGGPPRKVDRLRARREADSNFGVPQELDGDKKRKLLKDLKYQSAELRETGQITPDSQLYDDLREVESVNEDYWDYFEENEREFRDVRPNKKQRQLNARMEGIEINLKKAGLEEHSPRKAVEFLMNQMKQYAKRYISMCPAQLRRKKHSERVRKIRRGLEELAADIELIKLQRYERKLLKEVNSGLPDRVKGNKSPTQAESRGRSRPMKMEKKESLTDDSGNLLLDVILAGSMKKGH